jgi:hypothetical protein
MLPSEISPSVVGSSACVIGECVTAVEIGGPADEGLGGEGGGGGAGATTCGGLGGTTATVVEPPARHSHSAAPTHARSPPAQIIFDEDGMRCSYLIARRLKRSKLPPNGREF